MALTKLTTVLNKISTLANMIVGQATTVKTAFDYDVNVVKDYINDTLTAEIDTMDAENVKKTGDQTIDGVKTFVKSPIVPTPTTDMQTATKKYVDDNFTSKTEITTSRKLSALGDFSGTWNGKTMVETDPGIQIVVNEHTSQLVDISKGRIKNEYAYNIDSDSFPALIAGRRNKRTSSREILVIGDSHTWGQGSADCDYVDNLTSKHIGQPYNGGFGNRVAEYLSHKYDFYDSMVSFDNVGVAPLISTPYHLSNITNYDTNTTDPNKKSDKINLISGNIKIQSGVSALPTTDLNLFTPEARGISETPSDIGYQTTAREQKFGTGLAYFSNENTDNFNTYNKPSITITPNMSYSSEAGTFTTYKHNGAIYYGYNTADKSYQFIHIKSNILPDWVAVGSLMLIEGYGIVKITSMSVVFGGKSLFIANPDNSVITTDLAGYLYAGKELYYYASTNFKFIYPMQHHASKMFLSVFKTVNGAKVNIYFKSPYDGGVRNTDLSDTTASTASSTYHTNKTGYPLVYKVSAGGAVGLVSSPEAVISGGKITIDTYGASLEDVVYYIDWGYKQKGNIVFEYGGVNASATKDAITNSYTFLTRGFYFDGNIVKVHGFGAHSTSMLIGTAGDTNRAATDHIEELLQYSYTCPYLVVIQPPIVNDYLQQIPVETFKNNLDVMVDELKSFRNAAYPTTSYTDVLFITTIGGKVQEFSGTDTATIKYADYYNALNDYCEYNNYGLVDFRAWFKNAVSKYGLDYELIYDDDIHPSPYANEFITNELIKIIDMIM